MISFDVMVEKVANYDELLCSTEAHFNVDFNKYSEEYADGFNYENKYIVTASPTKISFLMSDSNIIPNLISEINSFLLDNFQNQLVGIRCKGKEDLLQSDFFPGIKTKIIL